MRAILQRVTRATVTVDGEVKGAIGAGLCILLGISTEDTGAEAEFLADKCAGLRIFADGAGKLNLSLLDSGGAALVVSNFTLYGDAKKGRRPSYIQAARPTEAESLYDYFVARLRGCGVDKVSTGVFAADMLVSIDNDGPVTLILDTTELMPKAPNQR